MMNKNFLNKKNKYKEWIEKFTIVTQSRIAEIEHIINTIDDNACINENDSLETIIFKKYLELENVKKVSEYVNELGYRIKTDSRFGERRYIPSDISEIITSDADIDNNLKTVVQKLQKKNYDAVFKMWV